MDVTIIGSGTVVPSPQRVCAGIHVADAADARVLLDCGPGVVHHMARFGVAWHRLTHVVFSHFHTDHIGDLPLLLFALRHGLRAPRRAPLTVLGPPGIREKLERLADAFGDYVRDPGFTVTIDAVEAGRPVRLGADSTLRAHSTPHTDASFGYRLESDGAVFGYTGDTGPSEALGDFMRDADILVAECSVPDEEPVEGHLTPATLAALARRARPGRLVVTHVYPQLPVADVPGRLAHHGWTGPVVMAHDGLRLETGSD